jgi:riboflavin synthase
MFTGIVERMGELAEVAWSERCGRIAIEARGWDRPVEVGESIAVEGICLTVVAVEGDRLFFDVLRETFERTNLGEKEAGDRLNLERALRWGDPMGGHVVIGHVDGIGRVRDIRRVGRDWAFEIACDASLMDGMVFKGSVGLDGVSLTIASMTEDSVTVHIIPFTYDVTTFGRLRGGDAVNVEVDLLGKFVRRLVERGRGYPEVTWDALRREGLVRETPEGERDHGG